MKLINHENVQMDIIDGLKKLDLLISKIQLSRDEHLFFYTLLAQINDKLQPEEKKD